MTQTTTTRTISEAELFREFIEADTIKKFDFQGRLRGLESIRYLLVEDGNEPDIGALIEKEILYLLKHKQSIHGLDFLANEFGRIAEQLRFVCQYFEELRKEREVRSGDDAEESSYLSIASAQGGQNSTSLVSEVS